MSWGHFNPMSLIVHTFITSVSCLLLSGHISSIVVSALIPLILLAIFPIRKVNVYDAKFNLAEKQVNVNRGSSLEKNNDGVSDATYQVLWS